MLSKAKNVFTSKEMEELLTNIISLVKEIMKSNEENIFNKDHTLKHSLMLFESELYYVRNCKEDSTFLYNQYNSETYTKVFKIFKTLNRNEAIEYQSNLYEKIQTLVNETRGKEPFLFKYYYDMSFPAYNQLRLLLDLKEHDIEKCNNEEIMCVLTDNGDWFLVEM